MRYRCVKLLFVGFFGTLVLAVSYTEAPAQPAFAVALQPAANNEEGPEVLARGPVHEAYATTVEMPKAGEIAPKAPPDPIEELPPDQKPEGDNVQWLPGYWDWDDERTDFIWISGFWRVPPPNHAWVPGSWNQVADGFQWTSGFWQFMPPNQAQPDVEFLPTPPAPIELGPNIPAPDATSVYVTGSWMWRGRYVWRPGFWMGYRPGWVWVPAHYRWTRLGYIFIDGYWDYPLDTRGVLFTPVYFPRRVFAPGYFYTPSYVVATPFLFGSLFVRNGYSSYYFGDYYPANYGRIGYQPWCAPALRGVAGLPARGWNNYDPLWSYYSVNYRQTPRWSTNVTNMYVGRYEGTMARPPRTLAQQNQVIQKVANTNVNNVTNNITVVNNNITVNNKDVSQHVMVAPLAMTPKLQTETKLQPITQQVRQAEVKHATDIRQSGVNRQKVEAETLKSRPATPVPTPGTPPTPPQPVKVKIDVPKAAVARAQVQDEKKQPPPAPVQPKIDPKVTPKIEPPKVEPKPKVDPPKIDPKPKVDPPKVDPKPKVDPPKVDPKPKVDPPKIDPKPMPKPEPPKPEPPKPEPPKKVDPPKVDPPKPPVIPKVDPPKVDPPKAPIPPKVDPPRPAVPKVDPPPKKADPPKVDPPPKKPDPPKVDPPKPPVAQLPPRQPVVQPRVDPPRVPVVPVVQAPPRQPVVQPRVDPPRAPVVQSRPPVVQPRVDPKQAKDRNGRQRFEGEMG